MRLKDRLGKLIIALVTSLLLGVASATVLAGPVDDAKAAGLVGEQPNGYLGVVAGSAPANVQRLVDEINLARREEYRSIAARRGISLQEVEAILGEKWVNEAPSGQYVRLPSGQWVQR